MEKHWFSRLVQAIQSDGRSLREISTAAGCGPNYVQQMIKNGKEPGSARLANLLEVLDGPSALFVLTGITATPEDLEFLTVMKSLSPEVKERALDLFAAMQAAEDA